MLGLWRNWCMQWLMLLVIVALNPLETATIQWTPGDDLAQWYEVRYRFTDVTPNSFTAIVKTTATQVQVTRPRSGHWAAEVRACRSWENADQCSEWVKSDEKGVPKPWAIFWKPPKPEGIKVEDYEH